MSLHEKRTVLDRKMFTEALRHMGEEDLLFLYNLTVERLNLIRQAKSTVALAQFSVGDRVWYTAANGKHVTGTILRLNKKTASVACDDGTQWCVAPGFLRKGGGSNGK